MPTALMSLLLLLIDMFIRGFQLEISVKSILIYALFFMLTFSILLFLKNILYAIPWRGLRRFTAIIVSLIYTGIYLLQYNLYLIYHTFAQDGVIDTIVADYSYWLSNSLMLITPKVFVAFIVLFALFYLFFSNTVERKIENRSTIKERSLILLLLLALLLTSHKKITFYSYLLLPVESFAAELVHYIRTERTDHSKAPKRNSEAISRKKLNFNILLLVNESLRSDHLNIFGYRKNTSPHISKFFKESYTFKNTISQVCATSPSLETIFTGLYHTVGKSSKSSTLWSYMSQLGFETFYFGSQTLSWSGGLDKWFLEKSYIDKLYSPSISNSAAGQDDSITIDAFSAYIPSVKKPFFGVIHFNDTHYPYLEHPESDPFSPVSHELKLSKVDALQNAYDNAIYSLDIQFEKLIEALKKSGKLQNTIIIFFSDHAEGFGNHRQLFHTFVFWIEGIRTPLMIHIPEKLEKNFDPKQLEQLRKNSARYVGNIDIFPTIIELLDINISKKLDGRSLLQDDDGYIFSTMTYDDKKFTYVGRLTGEKFTFDNEKMKIYHSCLHTDPKELHFEEYDASTKYNRVSGMKLIQSGELHTTRCR